MAGSRVKQAKNETQRYDRSNLFLVEFDTTPHPPPKHGWPGLCSIIPRDKPHKVGTNSLPQGFLENLRIPLANPKGSVSGAEGILFLQAWHISSSWL